MARKDLKAKDDNLLIKFGLPPSGIHRNCILNEEAY